jgi:hypothetical protein
MFAIDIGGPSPDSKRGSQYILLPMDYFNKWWNFTPFKIKRHPRWRITQ